jgi:hypothetical protein
MMNTHKQEKPPTKAVASVSDYKRRAWRAGFLILLLVNIYFISFFFVFNPRILLHTLDYTGIIKPPGTGPAGITVLLPCFSSRPAGEAAFTFYYPVHKLFKYKRWMWTSPNDKPILEGNYEDAPEKE